VLGDPASTRRQPSQCLWLLPGGVSCRARNGIGLPRRDFVLDGVEVADEFAVSVALHPAADLHSIEHAERSDHSVDAMTFIVVRHGLSAPGIDRQTRLRVVDYLDLTFHRAKVPRHRPGIGLKANHVSALAGKAGIAQEFEGTHAMRLQLAGPPTRYVAPGVTKCPSSWPMHGLSDGGLGVRHPL
jgi:hypothetical protein